MSEEKTRQRAVLLLLLLLLINIGVWLLTFATFGHSSALMGTALLAYSFGLRHAVDADHIAAIDGVTRKLMQQGQTPTTVGAFFSLGHSTIVILASLAIAFTTLHFRNRLEGIHAIGGTFGTIISALFLMAVALINLSILLTIWKKFRMIKRGKAPPTEAPDALQTGGWLSRLCQPLFRLVNHSWHMYLVGFLFGLGFDTATEIGLLGLSAAGAEQGMSAASLMLFPALFTVGMIFIDTLDNMVMIGAYGWAFSHPLRKMYYNMTITGASVVVALFIGGIEALGLLVDKLGLHGIWWEKIAALNDNLGNMGFWVLGLFVLFWLVSLVNYRLCGYDRLQAEGQK
ncbi:HoxN/HupN/NixA family nickel/cobalt transporter [Jejubacter calystegiae]|uniref:HoxN/HupN/NixA family nickel/cobalt transporter n=1 Tax=Jejubacter calystegiae TaxID=2579935 RepID=UPI003BA9F0C5